MSDAALAALAERAGDTTDDEDQSPTSRAISALSERASGKTFGAPAKVRTRLSDRGGYTEDINVEPTVGLGETLMHVGSGLGGSIAGGVAGIGSILMGRGTDSAADTVKWWQNALTYQPRVESGERNIKALASPKNPLTWPGRIGEFAAQSAEEAGWSPGAVTAMRMAPEVTTALIGAPGMPKNIGASVVEDIRNATRRTEAPPGMPPVISPEAAPTMPMRPAAAPEPVEMPAAPESAPAPLSAEGTARPAPFTKLEGEAPASFEEPPATVKSGTVPKESQLSRAETLRRIGLEDIRESAITGDAKAAATEYQTSKLDNSAGNYMRGVIDQERTALSGYSENLVRESGGSIGVDQTALHGRGNTIIEPLDSLREYFDNQTSALYKAANERAGNVPLETPKTREIVGDESEFLGTVEGESLLKGVKARMKALGMVDAEGKPLAVTVQQAERLKQYLGDQWTPRTSRLIRKLKDSIDDDVMSAAGEDLYKQARASRALRARTLDDPNGIAKIMDSDGPGGINRKVDIEKIPDAITNMGVNQFKHVIDTLKGMPEELQPQAAAAINEIRAQFANRVNEAGHSTQTMWNAKAVTKYLNSNRERMAKVFTPEEMESFRTLNDAGHILKKDQSYPGAAVQEHNLVKAGAMAAIRGGGTLIGGAVGGGLGAAAGGIVGEKLAGRYSEAASLKQAQKRVVKLSDILKKEKPGQGDTQ